LALQLLVVGDGGYARDACLASGLLQEPDRSGSLGFVLLVVDARRVMENEDEGKLVIASGCMILLELCGYGGRVPFGDVDLALLADQSSHIRSRCDQCGYGCNP
jgi:hypothetical protein